MDDRPMEGATRGRDASRSVGIPLLALLTCLMGLTDRLVALTRRWRRRLLVLRLRGGGLSPTQDPVELHDDPDGRDVRVSAVDAVIDCREWSVLAVHRCAAFGAVHRPDHTAL